LIFPNASGTFKQSFGIGGQPQDHMVPPLLSMLDVVFSALGNSSISSFDFNSTTREKLLAIILLFLFQLNSICQIQATLLQAHPLNNPPIGQLTSAYLSTQQTVNQAANTAANKAANRVTNQQAIRISL
jgi:hypothetical protein